METISNVASAASKAIFGEPKTIQDETLHNETAGQEPISGSQGRGTTNEPFDQGNAENPIAGDNTTQRTENPITDSSKHLTESSNVSETIVPPSVAAHRAEPSTTFAESDPVHASSTAKTSESLPHRPREDTDFTSSRTGAGVHAAVPAQSTNTSSYSSRDDMYSDKKETGDTTVRTGAGLYTPDSTDRTEKSTNIPSDTTHASTGAASYAAEQSEPSTKTPSYTTPDYTTPDAHKTTDKTGVVSDRNLDPPKAHDVVPTERASNPGAAPDSGASPQVKHQGADAPSDAPTGEQVDAVKGQKDEAEEILKTRDPNDHSGEPMKMHDGPEKPPATQAERRESKAGNPGGQEHGKDPKGTGEEWVKTSGMAVDGGDFDATKPGAGREADRLLEEKGIKKSTAGATSSTADEHSTSTAETGAHKEKASMGEKIKNKLHIGHHHK